MKSSTKKNLIAGLMALSGLAAGAPAALAQDTGFYAGIGVGQSDAKDACAGAPISCDNKDTGWKIFGGYQFNKNFGAEVGYVDFGKATANGVISGVAVSANAKAKGWEFLGVGTLPIADKFSAYGKLGFFRWDADVSATASIPGFAVTASASDKGTDLTYGIGLKYDFFKSASGRLEWQRYKDIGNTATTGKSDVDLISLGLVFKF